MNITKVIKKREKMEKEQEKEKQEKQEVNEVPENKDEEHKEENDNIPEADKSSYSKLSSNDYGLNLMDEAFELHNMNKKDILNRMKLFKTRLLFNEDSEQKFNNLPKLFGHKLNLNKDSMSIFIIGGMDSFKYIGDENLIFSDDENEEDEDDDKKIKEEMKEKRFEYIDEIGEAHTNKEDIDYDEDFM